MVKHTLYAIALGLVGAALVHIAVLFLVPVYSERDAWSRIASEGDLFEFVTISNAAAGGLVQKGANPFVRTVACRFAIDPGIVHVRASGEVPLWSAAIFDRKGQNVYSLNDRTTVGKRLDLVIATPVQMVELRKETPEVFAESVFVELDTLQGIVVVRVMVPDQSWSAIASEFLDGAECTRL